MISDSKKIINIKSFIGVFISLIFLYYSLDNFEIIRFKNAVYSANFTLIALASLLLMFVIIVYLLLFILFKMIIYFFEKKI